MHFFRLFLAETEHSMGEWSSGYSTCVNNNDINSPQVCLNKSILMID